MYSVYGAPCSMERLSGLEFQVIDNLPCLWQILNQRQQTTTYPRPAVTILVAAWQVWGTNVPVNLRKNCKGIESGSPLRFIYSEKAPARASQTEWHLCCSIREGSTWPCACSRSKCKLMHKKLSRPSFDNSVLQRIFGFFLLASWCWEINYLLKFYFWANFCTQKKGVCALPPSLMEQQSNTDGITNR